jgi:hypothetical protein
MSTTLKIAVIALVLIAIGTGIFLFHLGASGGLTLPSWSGFSSSTQFSFLPGKSATTLPVISKGSPSEFSGTTISAAGGSGGSNGSGGSGAAQLSTSITIDPSTISAANIPAGFTAAQLSPYFREVRFGSVSPGTSYYYGTITLITYFANSAATGTIDVTGWQIKSKNGGEYIPQAIALYDPSGLSAASDIRLKNSDVVNIYSTSAPFNLRINKCVGYIQHVANFSPSLPLNCPYMNQSQIANFTGACQNYIETLSGCSEPNMASPQIPRTDYACQDYLENNFNYKSCFEQHAADADFLSNQVWVWTGSNVVDNYHDVVDLYDRSGLLVDQYTY